MDVVGKTHARYVNRIWFDLFLSFFGGNGLPRRGHSIAYLYRYDSEPSYGFITALRDAPSVRPWSGQSTYITEYPFAHLGDVWSP